MFGGGWSNQDCLLDLFREWVGVRDCSGGLLAVAGLEAGCSVQSFGSLAAIRIKNLTVADAAVSGLISPLLILWTLLLVLLARYSVGQVRAVARAAGFPAAGLLLGLRSTFI